MAQLPTGPNQNEKRSLTHFTQISQSVVATLRLPCLRVFYRACAVLYQLCRGLKRHRQSSAVAFTLYLTAFCPGEREGVSYGSISRTESSYRLPPTPPRSGEVNLPVRQCVALALLARLPYNCRTEYYVLTSRCLAVTIMPVPLKRVTGNTQSFPDG